MAVILRLDERPRTTVAGRTDAGVHARGQVCHVDVTQRDLGAVGLDGLVRRLAGVLPPDVVVRSVSPAPPGFDARFGALWRRYAYRVADALTAVDPLRRHEVHHHARPLDVDRLNDAAQQLLGEHDFASFCRRRAGASTVRTLLDLSWERDPAGLAVATVRADAFCHSMVRSLVGALLPVGEGRRPPEWPRALLDARVRDASVTVAPARGLTLEEVAYPPDPELVSRVRQARTYRG